MDWSRRPGRLLAFGLVWLVMSLAHWTWAMSQDYETGFAKAALAVGLLVTVIALIWVRGDQDRTR